MRAPPCRDCEMRHVGCHGSCQRYLMYKDGLQVLKKKKAQEDEAFGYTESNRLLRIKIRNSRRG